MMSRMKRTFFVPSGVLILLAAMCFAREDDWFTLYDRQAPRMYRDLGRAPSSLIVQVTLALRQENLLELKKVC